MDTRRVLTDECRAIFTRAGALAAARGEQMSSADFLAAMAEQPNAEANAILDASAEESEIEPEDLKSAILDKYASLKGT